MLLSPPDLRASQQLGICLHSLRSQDLLKFYTSLVLGVLVQEVQSRIKMQ